MSKADVDSLVANAPISAQQPNETDCWAAFWSRIAEAWVAMPIELQQECLDEQAELDQQLLSA